MNNLYESGITEEGGFAGGIDAIAGQGGAVGKGAGAASGFAGGQGATSTEAGAAVGENSFNCGSGFAGGVNSKSGDGVAIGYGASTLTNVSDVGSNIDAIQLGTGNNPNYKTLQIYDKQLLDAQGYIPSARFNAPKDGLAYGLSYGAWIQVTKQSIHDKDVSALQSNINKKANITTVEALEARIAALEAKLN